MAEIAISMPINEWPDVDELVQEIFSKLDSLENLVHDVERRSKKDDGAKRWLQWFNILSDEVEDWWDDFRMISRKLKTLDLDEAAKTGKYRRISYVLERIRSFISSPISQIMNASVHRGNTLKTKELNHRLDEILNAATSSEAVPKISSMKSLHAVTFSRVEKPLVSLDCDKDAVMAHLIGCNDVEVKVISIVGKPGMGKTALAKQLYDDDEVKKWFHTRKWVQVSNDFNEEIIAKEMLGSPQEIGDSGLWSGSLLEVIKNQFSEKKFLLVMNNVTRIDPKIWESFLDSLKPGAPGSVILLTAWDVNTVKEVCSSTIPPHCLGPLTPNDGWKWLKRLSLSERSFEFHESVKEIGYKIVERFNGLAFGITIIGSHLQFKDTVEEWEQVSCSAVWDTPGYQPPQCAIQISFNDLSFRLQRCFLYIAGFPVGTEINVEKLIHLWMAEGYLGPPRNAGRNGNAMEMKGLSYFNELVMRSFFHNLVKSSYHKDKIIRFRMRETVHRFANQLSELNTSAAAVRGKGRSFYIVPPSHQHDIQGLLREWKCMRALDLSSCKIRELPKEVGNLILLQHLNLSGNPLKELPVTICGLSYLEFLDLHFCYILSCLPQRIGDLRRLRHLKIGYTTNELQRMPEGIGKLTSLRTLDLFRVGDRYNDLSMLEDLNELEKIRISIHGIKELKDPKFETKNMLRNLEIRFVGEGRNVGAGRFIDDFNPPPNLQVLKLDGYVGFQLPKWLEGEFVIKKLKRLVLRSASDLLSFNTLRTFSCLEFLWLYDIRSLKHLGREFFGLPVTGHGDYEKGILAFCSLRTLRIDILENWETWEDLNVDDLENNDKISVMAKLEELTIDGCPKLKALPYYILSRIKSLNKIQMEGQLLQRDDLVGYKPGTSTGKAIEIKPAQC